MNFIDQVKNFFFWGWKMRNSVDFDCNSIYDVLYLKLDTTYKCMVENSHLMWNRNENTVGMKKMRIARELAKRISEDQYLENNFIFPDKLTSFFGVGITGKYFKNYKGASKRHTNQMKNEKTELFRLMEKHLDGWWD